MTKEGKRFFLSTALISICAFSSRILGLVRQYLLASRYGATESQGLTDCYSAAFKLPDIIFNLVAFGAISIVLIPYFSGFIKKERRDELKYTCSTFLNFFFLFITFFIFIGFFFAPFFVRNFLVKGWTNEINISLTIKMTRILLLQILFLTLSGIFGSYLNALERFTAYAFALLSYNIGIIFGILVIAPCIGIQGVAWGAVLGSFHHFFIQGIGALKNGFKYNFGLPKFNREIKELIFIAIPRMIAISGEQLVKFFIVNIASFLFIGSIFIFENAENFSMVPFGTIAVSISTTAFPVFSKLYVEKEYDELLKSLLKMLRSCLFFILPVTLIMIVFKNEIIELLLVYKKFTQKDALLTANALAYYMMGIPFFSITIILVKFYYAQKRSIIPMIVTLISVFVTIVASYIFSGYFNISGLSIGRSSGYIIQTLLLILFIIFINKKENYFKIVDWSLFLDIIKIIIIFIILFITGLFVQANIYFFNDVKIDSIVKLILLGGLILIIYAILTYILKIPEIRSIINFRNKQKKI